MVDNHNSLEEGIDRLRNEAAQLPHSEECPACGSTRNKIEWDVPYYPLKEKPTFVCRCLECQTKYVRPERKGDILTRGDGWALPLVGVGALGIGAIGLWQVWDMFSRSGFKILYI
ncbi:MAG: hypothetical protein KDA84_25425, partial [Planctomycetaceae bacterium]|nr:hypothetical protein [Planctomycetaceae bacterium]